MSDRYARIYFDRIERDPKFDGIRDDPAVMGQWWLLLREAEKAWPAPAFRVPAAWCSSRTFRDLIARGIVDLEPDGRYRIHGLDNERGGRSAQAKKASDERWSRAKGNAPSNADSTSSEDVPRAMPRTRAGVLLSSPVETTNEEETTEGGPGGTRDAVDALHQRTGTYPGPKVIEWLNELEETHGGSRLVGTIDTLPMAGRNLRDYLMAVRDYLRAADHRAEKAERTAEKERAAVIRKANLPLLVSRHNAGQHADAPDPVCPSCREAA